MPLLRFSRDKRGYEHFYLVQPVTNRRGRPSDHRILYWYRSPPNVKVGREPFDEETQRLVEGNNPGVEFDWQKIRNTPFPPPQPTEHWRERRLAAKAARRLQREDSDAEGAADAEEPMREEAAPGLEPVPIEDGFVELIPGDAIALAGVEEPVAAATAPPTMDGTAGPRRRRRRRRGRRGRKPEHTPAGEAIQTETAGISSLQPDELSSGGSSSGEPDAPDGE